MVKVLLFIYLQQNWRVEYLQSNYVKSCWLGENSVLEGHCILRLHVVSPHCVTEWQDKTGQEARAFKRILSGPRKSLRPLKLARICQVLFGIIGVNIQLKDFPLEIGSQHISEHFSKSQCTSIKKAIPREGGLYVYRG